MSNSLWESTATHHAEMLIRELQITTLPICPFSIALELEIDVEPLPLDNKGVSGMLLRHDNQYGILYATYLNNEGFQRFSVAHEIGHYCLPGHPEVILVDGLHKSQAGFLSKDRYEMEADHFAANLLMPSFLFNPAIDKAGQGLDAIETLAKQCKTSLTATAIRYTEHTPDATAIVVSTDNKIDYCFMSEPLKEFRGLDWPRKGTPIPPHTLTYVFNKNDSHVYKSVRKDGDTNLQNWFGGDHEIDMLEEVIGLGNYGKTLTVLSTSNLPSENELEEEDNLIESWTPRFRR